MRPAAGPEEPVLCTMAQAATGRRAGSARCPCAQQASPARRLAAAGRGGGTSPRRLWEVWLLIVDGGHQRGQVLLLLQGGSSRAREPPSLAARPRHGPRSGESNLGAPSTAGARRVEHRLPTGSSRRGRAGARSARRARRELTGDSSASESSHSSDSSRFAHSLTAAASSLVAARSPLALAAAAAFSRAASRAASRACAMAAACRGGPGCNSFERMHMPEERRAADPRRRPGCLGAGRPAARCSPAAPPRLAARSHLHRAPPALKHLDGGGEVQEEVAVVVGAGGREGDGGREAWTAQAGQNGAAVHHLPELWQVVQALSTQLGAGGRARTQASGAYPGDAPAPASALTRP